MFGLNCPRVVFNGDIGENQDTASKEIDLPEILRFAQDDRLMDLNLDINLMDISIMV